MQDKHDAFAQVLRQKAKTDTQGLMTTHRKFISDARNGKYRSGTLRPAFLSSYFDMTEQEWDALWALIYG